VPGKTEAPPRLSALRYPSLATEERTEDRGQRTENRKQRAENIGQRAESGGQRSEVG
jgi:hypothetical protein